MSSAGMIRSAPCTSPPPAAVAGVRIALLAGLLTAFVTSLPNVHAQPVTQPFTFDNAPHSLPHVEHGDVSLADFDGDGDLDLFLSGVLEEAPFSALFENRGRTEAWLFEPLSTPLPALAYGASAWGDYDGDGDVDLVVTGSRTADLPYDPVTRLYRNDDGVLADVDVRFDDFHSGAVVWLDFDNDGDLDLLAGGERRDGTSGTILYRNDAGTFSAAAELPGIAYGDAAAADFDGDGDVDLALAGAGAEGLFAAVYGNDAGSFAEVEAPLEAAAFAKLDWGDYDGDGDLDLLLTGGALTTSLLEARTRLYRRHENGFFRVDVTFPDVFAGAAAFGDFDNDGDADALVLGARGPFDGRVARLYAREDPDAADPYVEKVRTVGVTFASAAWGDLEGDRDLDLVVTGTPTTGSAFVNLYENKRQVRTAFAAPEQLANEIEGTAATLRWAPVPGAASYNLRVGSRPGAGDVVPPMAGASGRRLLARTGNAQQNASWDVRDLAPGTYYWSVQAVDAAFVGSAFAAENSFTVGAATSTESTDEPAITWTRLYAPSPNPTTGSVTLRYTLEAAGPVRLQIFDVLGRHVHTLVDRHESTGTYRVEWDGRNAHGMLAGSGLYLVRLFAGSYVGTTSFLVSR